MLRVPYLLAGLVLLAAATCVTAASEIFLEGLQPAALMGGGNLAKGVVGAKLDAQLSIVQALGATRCRINLYPDTYLGQRNRDQPQERPLDPVNYLRLLVRSSTSHRPLRIRLVDSGNESFTTDSVNAISAWRHVWIRLHAQWTANWGGTPIGILDWPLQSIAIEAMNWGGGSPARGEKLWLDDVQVVQVAS